MTDNLKASAADKLVKTADAVAQAPAGDKTELDPPKDTPFTEAELAKYDGKDDHTPIYVGIKGRIYDGALTSRSPPLLAASRADELACARAVSAKRDMYGPGCGYHVFVGKDASRCVPLHMTPPSRHRAPLCSDPTSSAFSAACRETGTDAPSARPPLAAASASRRSSLKTPSPTTRSSPTRRRRSSTTGRSTSRSGTTSSAASPSERGAGSRGALCEAWDVGEEGTAAGGISSWAGRQ